MKKDFAKAASASWRRHHHKATYAKHAVFVPSPSFMRFTTQTVQANREKEEKLSRHEKEGRMCETREKRTNNKNNQRGDNRGQQRKKPWEMQLQQKSVHQSHPSLHLTSQQIFIIWGDKPGASVYTELFRTCRTELQCFQKVIRSFHFLHTFPAVDLIKKTTTTKADISWKVFSPHLCSGSADCEKMKSFFTPITHNTASKHIHTLLYRTVESLKRV